MNETRPLLDYSDPRPNSKIGRVRTALIYLIEQHRNDDALPTSVRFLFYELVMQRIVAKEGERPDKIVSAALTDLRENGLVPWDDIVDETREVFDFTGSATVAKDWLAYLPSARLDPWQAARTIALGDHDLAGNDIETNTRRVLEQLVGELDWQRLALRSALVYCISCLAFRNNNAKHQPRSCRRGARCTDRQICAGCSRPRDRGRLERNCSSCP
jgi:hypothetical protein